MVTWGERMKNILLTPGPATTTETVKQALTVPDMWTRHKDFEKLMKSVRHDLVKIADGDDNYTCVLFAGSGTAVMEAAILSLHPTNRALIVTNGTYGERFCKIAERFGVDFIELKFKYGEKIDLSKIAIALDSGMFSHLFVTHNETTTGILNDIKGIGKLAKDANVKFIVDSISSFAGVPFSVRDCNIDIALGTSVKCIQGMAGIAFVICKKDYLDKHERHPSFYSNLYEQYRSLEDTGQSQFTIPVQIMYALKQAIDEFFEEGAHERYMRYSKSHRRLIEGMKSKDFKRFLSDDVAHSHLIETFYYLDHPNFDYDIFRDKLYEKGYTIYASSIPNTFRICNIGAINSVDMSSFLLSMNLVLEEMKCL